MILSTLQRTAHKLYASGVSYEYVSGPGVGKSSVVREVARQQSIVLKVPFGFMVMICSGMDPADVRGFIFPLKGEDGELMARFTRPIVFPNLFNIEVYVDGALIEDYDGPLPECGIVFLDEFGQAEMEVQKPLGQYLLDGRIGEYKLKPGWVRWAASNRIEDRSGVVKRAMFLQNRMGIINIEPNLPAWEDWAMRKGLHPLIVSFANRHPDHVFKDFIPKEPGPFCTPRSLELTNNALMSLRDKGHGDTRLPDDDVATEVVSGLVGNGTMTVLMTHLRLANDLPEISDVAKHPMTAKIPSRIDARYVMALTLPHHIDRKNAGAFISYMSRPEMDKEMQILFVTNCIRRGPEALNNPEFQKWVTTNKDLALVAFG